MATLTNPINAQNIIDRFADYVVATANSGIVWGTNAVPFPEMSTAYFGGTTAGKAIGTTGSFATNPINASQIYNAVVAETYTYTNIRNLNAKLNVTGGGGNTGSRPTAGIVYNNTQVAYLNTNYRQTLTSPNDGGVAAGNAASVANLQQLFANCQAEYNAKRGTIQTIQIDVCHASCHSSCHSSRGRR